MRADMTPFRLFMTADAVGGVMQYALDCAAGLRALGIETTLAVLGPRMSEEQHAAARRIDGMTLIETGLPLDWLAEDADAVTTAAYTIAALAERHKAEIVHLNTPALAVAHYSAPVVAVAHSCLASWWVSVKGTDLPDDFVWRTRLMERGLSAADALVCPSHAFSKAILALYGRDTVVVQNGRAATIAPVANAHPAAIAFTAGRLWDEGKNIAVLDAAASLVNLPLEAAGPLEGPNDTRLMVQHLTTVGVLNEAEMRGRLVRQPIFISAALYEPFGLTVLEAAQAGCALVLSDIPTFEELWNGAALFVPACDPQAFAAAITSVAANPAKRAHLGMAARLRARRYSIAAMTNHMAEIYQQLRLRGRRASRGASA
jgi:glycogen(starch) synthase